RAAELRRLHSRRWRAGDPLVRRRPHRQRADAGYEVAVVLRPVLLAPAGEQPVERIVGVGDEAVQGGRRVVLSEAHAPSSLVTGVTVREIETPHGPARAHLYAAHDPRAALVLGHGAGGGVEAPDLGAAREAARSERITVALVEQPYRVAGRRSPACAAQLDAAWTAVVEELRAGELPGLPLI